jgi:hypothetical protein
VRRLILLAIGLSALLWAATLRSAPVATEDIAAMSEARPCLLASDSHEPGDSDRQWRHRRHTIAAVTESIWKGALVHAELAATPSPISVGQPHASSSPDPPVRPAPEFLRHTPLLI